MPSNDTLAVDTQSTKVWGKMLGGNPVPWLLSSDEPAARWVTLTAVLDRELTDPAVLEARQQVVADIHTLKLVERLPEWASGVRLSGHDSPAFAPHLLNLLAGRARPNGIRSHRHCAGERLAMSAPFGL
jgi:hypothetical protein